MWSAGLVFNSISNATSLITTDIPRLSHTIRNYWNSDTVTNDDRIRLGFEATGVIIRSSSVALNTYHIILARNLNSNSLTQEQKAKLQSVLNNVIKGEVTVRVVLVTKKVFESYKAQINPLNANLFFETSNLLLEGLHVTEYIDNGFFEKLSGHLNFAHGIFNVSSILRDFEKIESWKDRCLFQYDYFFPAYQLQNIALDFSLLALENEYQDIPQEHKRNRVFRHFKCYFSEEPIRYPVVVVDENNQPYKPLKLFERKTLLNRLISQVDLHYPGTQTPIDFAQVREHLGVRTIIEDEMRRLQI